MPPRKDKSAAASSQSPPFSVDKSLLDSLMVTLSSLLSSLSDDEEDEDQILEPPKDERDINGILNALLKVIQQYGAELKTLQNQVKNTNTSVLEKRIRVQDDELDENRQRSLKGNLIISSLSYTNQPKPCLIKNDDQLKEEDLSLTNHIISIVKEKYDVILPPEDIQACHRLPTKLKNGQSANMAVVLRVWNRKEGSAWSQICDKIKSGVNIELNVYLNFQLTRQRSSLLHAVRQLKKEKKVSKFYVDENAKIQIKVKENDRKLTLTYFSKPRSNEPPRTYSIPELRKLVE